MTLHPDRSHLIMALSLWGCNPFLAGIGKVAKFADVAEPVPHPARSRLEDETVGREAGYLNGLFPP
jgi:hypothetical protein